jgi:3-isopropylmalate/(R)-2-methylmalate dehydratase small subunit
MNVIGGHLVPLNRHNVDTDQIIPARYLKGTGKEGLGQVLFYDWRFDADGAPKLDFVLNDPRYAHGRVLVAGHNFGCGSSREHAPWALKDYGFQAILAISFADIFNNNALKNQLLPVALPEPVILKLLAALEADAGLQVTIRLDEQRVYLPTEAQPVPFDIDPFRKTCLMDNLDDIQYTLKHLTHVQAFEGV